MNEPFVFPIAELLIMFGLALLATGVMIWVEYTKPPIRMHRRVGPSPEEKMAEAICDALERRKVKCPKCGCKLMNKKRG